MNDCSEQQRLWQLTTFYVAEGLANRVPGGHANALVPQHRTARVRLGERESVPKYWDLHRHDPYVANSIAARETAQRSKAFVRAAAAGRAVSGAAG
jgi:hypothetical protein